MRAEHAAGLDLFQRLPSPYFSWLVGTVRGVASTRPGGVADLARGNPEVPPPPHVLQALAAAAHEPGLHGYPPFAGMPELRAAFARHHERRFGVHLDPDREVVVVPGTKTAIALVCMALAGAGGVLLPDPGYADYPSGIALAGSRAIPLPLDPRAAYAPAWGAVPPADLAAARMAFLNYPSNPSGTVAVPGLFEEAIEVATRNDFTIVHDLAYGELAWGPDGSEADRPTSFLATPGACERGVELVSMSKTWCIAGWRIGFVCGNEQVIDRVRLLLDHLTVGVPMPLQLGAIAALAGPQESVAVLRDTYRRRATRVGERLGVAASEGGYYTWFELPPGLDWAQLLNEYGVALAPGEGFGRAGAGWARLSVAVADEQLELGLDRLLAVFNAA